MGITPHKDENDLKQRTGISFILFGTVMVWGLVFHLFPGPLKAAPPDLTDQMEKLGNPLKKSQNKPYARNVKDLHLFKNRIYIGHGDYDGNAGPIDIWYWSRSDNEFVKQGTIPDEEADRYNEINGQLYLPGIDPRGRGSGHFYRLEDGEWVTHKSLPSSTVHGFDIAGRKNKLLVSGEIQGKGSSLMVSNDNGKSWETYKIPADRPYTMFILKGRVYITTYSAVLTVFNGQSVNRLSGTNLLPGVRNRKNEGSYRVEDPLVLQNKIVLYTGHYSTVVNRQKKRTRTDPRGLFGATISGNKMTVSRLVQARCEDVVREENTMYTVAYRWKNADNPSEGVVNTVYKSTDVNNWKKLFTFETATMARSMEVHDGTFYFGLGCQYRNLHESSGSILKISNPDKTN